MPYKNLTLRRTLNTSLALTASLVGLLMFAGCSSLWRGKTDDVDNDSTLQELMKMPNPPDLIREAAISRGLQSVQVDGVAVVNGLAGTGGPVNPSGYRDQLLEEMKRNKVQDPNQFLELDSTAMVRVRAVIPPGARRGDPLDLRLIAPAESNVTDLHNGWLLDTRLRHQQRLQSNIHQSEVMLIGMGPVVTRADFESGADVSLQHEGMVLSGGRVQETRNLGLILRPEFQHVRMSASLAAAVNRRFFFFDGTTRRGIARAVEDDFIEIEVHPRYHGNEHRLMAVIHATAVEPESSSTQQRLSTLASRLREPATAADAALQLEALGESAIPTLLEGVESTNPELRFYAAQALAYLDRAEAITPLEQAAREVAAFRQPAINALEGMPQQLSVDALRRLMLEASLETRYSAFVSLRHRHDGRRVLSGRKMGDAFTVYQVATDAIPAIVVATREEPEIVLFGKISKVDIPDFLFGSGGIVVKPDPADPGKLRITRFQPNKEDQLANVPSTVQGMLEGIVMVGGGYGDAIKLLRECKHNGYLLEQLAIDPLPHSRRTYFRESVGADEEDDEEDDELEL
jgi:hypothetical protein